MYSPEYCVKPRPAKKPGIATKTKYYTQINDIEDTVMDQTKILR